MVFISSVIYTAQHEVLIYPPYCWFCVAFMFCLISGILVVIVSNTARAYHVAIVGFLAAGLILTTSSVNDLIYSSNIAAEIAAAGFIVLSAVNVKAQARNIKPVLTTDQVVWIFYFAISLD
jgi:hypothetical protein